MAGTSIVQIIVGLLPLVGQVVGYIEDGQTEVRLPRTVWSIDDTILDNTSLNGGGIERVVAWMSQVPFNTLLEASIVCNCESCKHIYLIS